MSEHQVRFLTPFMTRGLFKRLCFEVMFRMIVVLEACFVHLFKQTGLKYLLWLANMDTFLKHSTKCRVLFLKCDPFCWDTWYNRILYLELMTVTCSIIYTIAIAHGCVILCFVMFISWVIDVTSNIFAYSNILIRWIRINDVVSLTLI